MDLTPVVVQLEQGPPWTLSLLDLGLACCAVEFGAAAWTEGAFAALGARLAPAAAVADVMVVSGTVTHKSAPLVQQLYRSLPEPRRVISFGACANSGGPYWDSYCVTKGVHELVPVDLYVPGCPPRPQALLHALLQLQARSS